MFIQRKRGGPILIILSIVFLLLGGGFFPPLIGIIGGAAGTQINKSLSGNPGTITYHASKLGHLPLIILLIWLLGQFPVGY